MNVSKDNPQVQNALNLVLTIKDPVEENYTDLQNYLSQPSTKLKAAANVADAGLVHFARMLPLDNNQTVVVITSYDGSFDDYLQSFIKHFGWFFNEVAKYIEPTYPTPIGEGLNTEKFSDFVKEYNVDTGLFSAYPTLTVQDILAATNS